MNSACKLTMSLALLAGGASSMALAQTVINFDDLADKTMVTNQYTAQGVTFSGGQVLTFPTSLNANFPPHSDFNVIYDYQYPTGGNSGVIRADAVGGTWSMAGGYITGNHAIALEAYDANGNLLGSDATAGANYIGFGTPNEFLQVVAPNIAYVLFHDSGNTFTLDDFTFQSSDNVTAVPLPAAAWAGMAMLGGLATARKARQRLASR